MHGMPRHIGIHGHCPPYRFSLGQQRPLRPIEQTATVVAVDRGEQLGSRARDDLFCRVEVGALAECAICPSGRRQIVDLILPSNCIIPSHRPDFYREAIADRTRVTCFPRRRLDLLADSDPSVARMLRDIGRASVARLQNQLLALGQTTAQKKVATFICQLSGCLAEGPKDLLLLPLSRHDIADYLGISVETVSRAFTDLQRQHAIEMAGARRVRIVNLQLLEGRD
jgi:CRP/FNR family transcriptional regulator, nitrogen fixation regulation protein